MTTLTFETNGIIALKNYAATLKHGAKFKGSRIFKKGNQRLLANILLTRHNADGSTSIELNVKAAAAFDIVTDKPIRICAAVNPLTNNVCLIQL